MPSGLKRLASSKLISQSDLHSPTCTRLLYDWRAASTRSGSSLLGEGRGRQDDVGQRHGGRIVEQVDDDDEVELLQRLVVKPARAAWPPITLAVWIQAALIG